MIKREVGEKEDTRNEGGRIIIQGREKRTDGRRKVKP